MTAQSKAFDSALEAMQQMHKSSLSTITEEQAKLKRELENRTEKVANLE